MQTFEIKRGHGKTLDNGGLKKLMEEEFGSVDNTEDSIFNSSFKALTSIVTNILMQLELILFLQKM